MKNLTVISPSFWPAFIYGGPIVSVYEMCSSISRQNVNVSVLTTNANGASDLEYNNKEPFSINGFEVLYFRRFFKTFVSFGLLFHLYNTSNKNSYVWINGIFNFVCIFSLLVCKLRKSNVIISPRGSLGEWVISAKNKKLKVLWLFFFKLFLPTNSKFHATGDLEIQEIRNYFPKSEVFLVPNGIRFDLNAAPNSDINKSFKSDSKVKFVFLGRVVEKKGLELLISAISELNKNGGNYTLDIGGSGDDHYIVRLNNLILNLNVSDFVNFHGEIIPENKYEFLSKFDYFAMTSYNENFGNVYLEALYVGLPVLATINSPWSILYDYKCGVQTKLDVVSIIDSIKQLQSLTYYNASNNARILAKSFCWDVLSVKFVNFIFE